MSDTVQIVSLSNLNLKMLILELFCIDVSCNVVII